MKNTFLLFLLVFMSSLANAEESLIPSEITDALEEGKSLMNKFTGEFEEGGSEEPENEGDSDDEDDSDDDSDDEDDD